MAKIINKRNVIGDRFKEAVASLISFTPTTTITGTNVQAALEEVDAHVLASTAISDDEFEETTEIPRDADTLCGVDGNQIISELSELGFDDVKIEEGTLSITCTSNTLAQSSDSVAIPSGYKIAYQSVYASGYTGVFGLRTNGAKTEVSIVGMVNTNATINVNYRIVFIKA